ncbi:hypothetical protein ATO13_23541 [Stappia sp. 22II-S9-Z10]|nr:hypothetical protein ATO13_23541 [Stappia sp. 22II-S9-Z10]
MDAGMSGKDAIARGAANAADDIRYHVVEKGWFDQKAKDDAVSRDVAASIDNYEHDLDNSAWRNLPEAERFDEADAGKQADISDFYGDNAGHAPDAGDLYGDSREKQQELDDFYGNSGSQEGDAGNLYGHSHGEADMADFYGDGGSKQAEASDLYGHEIEQERD